MGSGFAWLESAADLLAGPDPGPTPFLVDRLIADRAICAVQGSQKVGKTWLVLELAISIVTGRPAFGRFSVPVAGPVLLVVEESGRDALRRRIAALAAPRFVAPADLADLKAAANQRVRLDDAGWRAELLAAGRALRPRAIILDPLVRLKGAGVDEDSQKEMGPILDFMRDLRDDSGAAVIFVHHTGHNGRRMRGSSDLEAYWESKLSLSSDKSGVSRLCAEHREAASPDPFGYRLREDARSDISLVAVGGSADLTAQVIEYVWRNPGNGTGDVARGVGHRRPAVKEVLDQLTEAGTLYEQPVLFSDKVGRPRQRTGWFPASSEASPNVPTLGQGGTAGDGGTSAVPPAGGLKGPAGRQTKENQGVSCARVR